MQKLRTSQPSLLYVVLLLAVFYLLFMMSVSGLAQTAKQNQVDVAELADELRKERSILHNLVRRVNKLSTVSEELHSRAAVQASGAEHVRHGVEEGHGAERDVHAEGEAGDFEWSEAAFLEIKNYTDPAAQYAVAHPDLVAEIVKSYYDSGKDTFELQRPLHRVLDYIMVYDCKTKKHDKPGCIDGFVLPEQAEEYFKWAHQWMADRPEGDATLCETGFNAGHSAATFLLANRALHMVSFDLFIQAYSSSCLRYLTKVFGAARVTVNTGDSYKSLVKMRNKTPHQKCDAVSVDGAHSFKACMKDVQGLSALLAAPKTPILMDDTAAGFEMQGGPAEVWRDLKKKHKLKQVRCVSLGVVKQWRRGSKAKPRGFCVGELNPELEEFTDVSDE